MIGRIISFRSSRWLSGLSNKDLGIRYEAALSCHYEGDADTARIDALGDEISRRERIGLWTEQDWYA